MPLPATHEAWPPLPLAEWQDTLAALHRWLQALGKLLGEKATADEIAGKWKVDAGQLVLTDIKAGEAKGKESVKLRIYRTAPTVVRVGEPQYVFAVGR